MTTTPPIQALTALGFTTLEAEVYVALLGDPQATGYRVARAIGKPTANTYKAIESLQAKGAVLVDDGERRVCRAVPVDELLRSLDRQFRERRVAAAEALTQLDDDRRDDRVYRIRSTEQVFERCRTMLAAAHDVAIVDLYPDQLETLRGELVETAERGVDVWAKTYAPVDMPGIRTVQPADVERIRSTWPGHLNAVVDGREMLISMFDGAKEVVQAIWTRSTVLSCMFHSGLGSELMYSQAHAALTDDDPQRAEEAFRGRERLFLSRTSGYQSLMALFGDAEEAEENR